MMFDKLDKIREQAVVTAIEKIIDSSRYNPDESLSKVAARVLRETEGMTPELTRRACEAFNKSKSVFVLQKRASEDRAEDFDLIDPDEVHRQIYGYHQKAASVLEMPARQHTDNIPELREKLQKVAFEATEAPEPISLGVLEREIHRTSIRLDRSVEKLRERVGMHKQASEDAIHRACQVMRRLRTKPLQKVARHVVNRYAEDGVRLVKLLGAYIEKELPIEKTAAAAIFPLREPYTSIAIAIDEARSFSKMAGMLEKTADILPDLKKTDTYTSGLTRGSNIVRRGVGRLLDPALEFAKSPIYQQLTKDYEDAGDKAFDATLRNRLQQLRATQAFVDIAADDFIKDYPIDDAVQAYNNIVGTMPELLEERYTPWLKALVREQLVQGNVYDANTIQQLQTIGKEIKKGKVDAFDMALKNLEAAKGSTKPGLQLADPGPLPERAKPQPEPAKDTGELDLKREKMQQDKELAEAANKIKNRELGLQERKAAAEKAAKRKAAKQQGQK